ncbi:MAG: hypothetical protein HY244_03575 [Rhizobiales bacterium]|nr:hypothetical protein [Hyphomicrobiales bacterium]
MATEVSTNQVLANEVLAPLPEVALSEPDYRAFCAALEASARGRAFLAEYARRNRHADTEIVLAALERLEAQVARQAASTEADRIRQELRALLAALAGAQPLIDASSAAIKAAKLAALIGFVRHRIESIVAPAREPSALPPEVAALIMLDAEPAEEPAPEAARAHLTVVPPAEQPELPIPAPAAGPPPAIALVQAMPEAPPASETIQPLPENAAPAPETIQPAPEIALPASEIIQRRAAFIPEVNLFDGAPVKAATAAHAVAELAVAAAVVAETPVAKPAVAEFAELEIRIVETVAATPPPAFELTLSPPTVKPPADPLAHIMALSDEERIALFS